MKNPFPAEVKKIGIAAPASSADRVRYASSRQWMSERGIVLLEAEHLFSGAPLPYLSASDEMRAEDLNRLIGDPSVDLILCLRGGYGSPRILDRIDWETLRRRRLPLVGFSDITAIHLAMLAKRAGVPVAGQMAANLSLSMRNDPTFRAFRRALDTAFHGKKRCSRSVPLEVLREGACMGRIVTANLTLLAALCGSEWLPDFSGTILTCPASILERSRISLIRRRRAVPAKWIERRYSICSFSESPRFCRSSLNPITALSGVRIS